MSNLEMNGTITKISEVQQGTAKSGNEWKKLTFAIKTEGDYPKVVAFTVFGEEKVDNFMKFNKIGQNVDVSFNAESREYNDKFYTDLQAWKIFAGSKENKPAEVVGAEDGYSKASDLPF
tara:strand:- start:1213 stop:1569 length:357 start_codon:yes stop_codon:yes gene_type:complete